MSEIMRSLVAEYPQLYLNPDKDMRETYRRVVLRGEEPEVKSTGHYTGDEHDYLETVDTPAGLVRVVTLGNRRDFELVIRGFLAAKKGPQEAIPESQGASMLTVFNWSRINAHLSKFPEKEQSAEFKRFTSVKENYLDMLVVLSRGPYSNVKAEEIGCTDEDWLDLSDTIRRYHELTHVICRRLYPSDIDAVRDELIADAVGLYAAYGCFDPEKEKMFLGIRNGQYIGGRLENYTDNAMKMVGSVSAEIEQIQSVVNVHSGMEPFDLIPVLMEKKI